MHDIVFFLRSNAVLIGFLETPIGVSFFMLGFKNLTFDLLPKVENNLETVVRGLDPNVVKSILTTNYC